MPKPKFVIVHGSFGHPQENWFPWLAAELRRCGQRVLVPAFPTPKGQHLTTWRAAFAEQVGPVDPRTILIGHSLGPALILRLLEEAPEPVLGTFLVSAFVGAVGHPVFDPLNASFFEKPLEWDRIRANAGMVHVYHGENDPYIALERSRDLAHHLQAPLTIVPRGGHLNTLAGFAKFDKLLEDLRTAYPWLEEHQANQLPADATRT